MKLKLNKLTIENFKGLERYGLPLDGASAVIKGENETKKTTVKDAFHWLLFDKSSDGTVSSGKGHFGLRPHDKRGRDIHGLTVMVESELAFNGEVHTLRKEQTENIIKGTIKGYPNQYYIDDAPVLKKDFDSFLEEYISEDVFKLLTDVFYFLGELHWQKRRGFLAKYAEDAGLPKGFDNLLERAGNRNLEDYKKALMFKRDGTKDRKGYKGEAEEIPTRIDEKYKELKGITETDTTIAEEKRDKIKTEIEGMGKQRKKLSEAEEERQAKIDLVNELTKKKVQRETELKSDTTGVKSLLDEKAKIEADVAAQQQMVFQVKTNWTTEQTSLSAAKNNLDIRTRSLNAIRDEYNKIDEAKASPICFSCNQKLPPAQLAENEELRKKELAIITKDGNDLKVIVDDAKKSISKQEAEVKKLNELLKKVQSALHQAEKAKDKRFAEIDKLIKANETIPPESDKAWKIFDDQIKKTEAEIGKPVSEQLQKIDDQRTIMESGVAQLNDALKKADQAKESKLRITELETREKELAQLIADVDKELELIKQYNLAHSKLVESAVNDKFQYITFKLFDIQINGDIDERVCEAMMDGTKWSDMSKGQSIKAGVDAINTLSAFYEVSVPLFIDGAEGMTLPIEAKSQTIKLFAEKGIKTLIVEREGALAHV